MTRVGQEKQMDTDCLYCGRPIPDDIAELVPAVADIDRWNQVSRFHDADCEWVETKAHQLEPLIRYTKG